MKKKTAVTVHRSSKTGRFVTKDFADRHKATTQKESRRRPRHKRSKY